MLTGENATACRCRCKKAYLQQQVCERKDSADDDLCDGTAHHENHDTDKHDASYHCHTRDANGWSRRCNTDRPGLEAPVTRTLDEFPPVKCWLVLAMQESGGATERRRFTRADCISRGEKEHSI